MEQERCYRLGSLAVYRFVPREFTVGDMDHAYDYCRITGPLDPLDGAVDLTSVFAYPT